jgi:hypothetical protein
MNKFFQFADICLSGSHNCESDSFTEVESFAEQTLLTEIYLIEKLATPVFL